MATVRETDCTENSDCTSPQICGEEGKCVDPAEPDPAKNIGRVIIARGDIAWDVQPEVWDDLVSPCCKEEEAEEETETGGD